MESLPQTLIFYNISAIKCRRPYNYIFKTINSVRSNHLSLKYQRITTSDCKDKGLDKVCGKESIPLNIIWWKFNDGRLLICPNFNWLKEGIGSTKVIGSIGTTCQN